MSFLSVWVLKATLKSRASVYCIKGKTLTLVLLPPSEQQTVREKLKMEFLQHFIDCWHEQEHRCGLMFAFWSWILLLSIIESKILNMITGLG